MDCLRNSGNYCRLPPREAPIMRPSKIRIRAFSDGVLWMMLLSVSTAMLVRVASVCRFVRPRRGTRTAKISFHLEKCVGSVLNSTRKIQSEEFSSRKIGSFSALRSRVREKHGKPRRLSSSMSTARSCWALSTHHVSLFGGTFVLTFLN